MNIQKAHLRMVGTQVRRVVYNLPMDARRSGVQLRWWQPRHAASADHWAIDNVEIDALVSGICEY